MTAFFYVGCEIFVLYVLKGGVCVLVRDQIYGDISFSVQEEKFIMSKSFQRLRYIKQLGFVEMEFPGATHNRFQHSLGTCKCVTDMYKSVCRNNKGFRRDGDIELLRFIALAHDFGHAPFSHASSELSSMTHEERLESLLKMESRNILFMNPYDIPCWELIHQVYNGRGLTYMGDPHLITLHGFMDGFVDADKLDYLERDAINCGVVYGRFDRDALVNSLTLVKNKKGIETLAILPRGIQALESFILARYYMFSHIYMSPSERMTRKMVSEELKRDILKNGMFPDDPKKFIELDDTKYCHRLKCLHSSPWELIYDGEFNEDIKRIIDKNLGQWLECDTPRKTIFRRDMADETFMVYDPMTEMAKPCSEVSPLLKNIEYMCIHRLRYYAKKEDATALRGELKKLLHGMEAIH